MGFVDRGGHDPDAVANGVWCCVVLDGQMTRGEAIRGTVLVRLCLRLRCAEGDVVQFRTDDGDSFRAPCVKVVLRA